MATAKPMTVMIPNGTSTIPIPDPSTAASGNVVALKLVSLVVIVTVVNVVLFSLAVALAERKGMEVVVVAGVENTLVLVLAAVTAMVRWHCSNPRVCLVSWK